MYCNGGRYKLGEKNSVLQTLLLTISKAGLRDQVGPNPTDKRGGTQSVI
jgi:hypothetical protein